MNERAFKFAIFIFVRFRTDSKIQQTIRECFGQCTIITVAHRLNTVMNSDRIMVLSDGKLVVSSTLFQMMMYRNIILIVINMIF